MGLILKAISTLGFASKLSLPDLQEFKAPLFLIIRSWKCIMKHESTNHLEKLQFMLTALGAIHKMFSEIYGEHSITIMLM